jgi:5-methylcytosine-specific restriction endonuclease McrA
MPNNKFYHSRVWKELRIIVLKRDNYFCRECARQGKPFVKANTVHHVQARAKAPQAALDVDNLESICPTCHNKAHPEKSTRRPYIAPPPESKHIRIIKI